MEETQSSTGTGSVDVSAWLGARLGRAVDIYVDRSINKPVAIQDPSQAYGMDQYGRMYSLGQNASPYGQAQQRAMFGSPLMLGIAVVLLIVLLKD